MWEIRCHSVRICVVILNPKSKVEKKIIKIDRNGPIIFNSISPLFVFTHKWGYFWYVPKLVDPSRLVYHKNKSCPRAYTMLLYGPNLFISTKKKKKKQFEVSFISREAQFQLFNSSFFEESLWMEGPISLIRFYFFTN